jgi:sodium-dependent dicarboxylate transporter 2/3/5
VNEDQHIAGPATHQRVGLLLGPVLAALMLLNDAPSGLGDAAWLTAAVGVLMAVWWTTEAVPIAVTALLPVVVFPLLGLADPGELATAYGNNMLFLFLGGFIVAFAMQRWNLHRRIALNVLQLVGGNGRSLVGGFMLASGLISMWVMNTSTTMMLLPIAVSVILVIHKTVGDLDAKARDDFQFALLLGVAYGSSIGGMATLIGTVPNALLVAFMKETYGTEIDFARWMLVGLPIAAAMLPLAWLALTRGVFKVDFRTSAKDLVSYAACAMRWARSRPRKSASRSFSFAWRSAGSRARCSSICRASRTSVTPASQWPVRSPCSSCPVANDPTRC